MDVQALVQQVDLMALAQAAGATFDGRHSSRCPLHQGDNPHAFHVYQRDGVWRWHCFTGCQAGGDAVEFVKRWRRTDFKGAVEELERWIGGAVAAPAASSERQADAARESAAPSETWRERAQAFISWAQDQLWMGASDEIWTYLTEQRGLASETIGAFGLGWNPREWMDQPVRWGLSQDRPVRVPAGIVIPGWKDDGLWYVKVRTNGTPKYLGITGGRAALFGVSKFEQRETLLLVEGEFDAMLTWQVVRDVANVATMGGAGTHLTTGEMAVLATYRRIVAIYDDDEAGRKGLSYLRSVSGRVETAVPPAHDITDAWRAGVDIWAWLEGVIG